MLPYYLTTLLLLLLLLHLLQAPGRGAQAHQPYYLTTSLPHYYTYYYRHLGEARKLINVLREVYHVGVVRVTLPSYHP